MVAKFKKWMYLCSTRAFVFNFKELHLFVFKEQTILIQLQERFIDSRMLYRFKKIILIQQTFVQESNTTLFLQENYIPNFCFFQEIYIHSTKPIKNIYSFKFRVPSPSRLSFQQIKFPDIVDKNMHSTNLAVPTSADLKSLHIIHFSRRYQVLVRFSIESNARQEEDLQYLSTLVKPKALRCNKVFSFISFIVLPANSFSWAL